MDLTMQPVIWQDLPVEQPVHKYALPTTLVDALNEVTELRAQLAYERRERQELTNLYTELRALYNAGARVTIVNQPESNRLNFKT